VYQTDDEHLAKSTALGEAETVEKLGDRVLAYRGHLSLTSDATTLYYLFTRELLRDDVVLRTKTWREAIPRDLQWWPAVFPLGWRS
jgi:hypothetical protein